MNKTLIKLAKLQEIMENTAGGPIRDDRNKPIVTAILGDNGIIMMSAPPTKEEIAKHRELILHYNISDKNDFHFVDTVTKIPPFEFSNKTMEEAIENNLSIRFNNGFDNIKAIDLYSIAEVKEALKKAGLSFDNYGRDQE